MKLKIMVLLSALFACLAFAAAGPNVEAVEEALHARFNVTELTCYELLQGIACEFRLVAPSRAIAAKGLEEILGTLPDDYEFRLRGHVTATRLLSSSGRVFATRDRAGAVTSQVMPNSTGGGGPSSRGSRGSTFGTECTTYVRGNTSGVSCRTWGQ